MASMKNVHLKRFHGPPESLPKAIWTDSVNHITDVEWPLHAVPLFVFCGKDRPRPGYREEARFTVRDERYIPFALRLRCGAGDKYMGGTIGLVHSEDLDEAAPGSEGQLATVIDIGIQPNNTIVITCVGDLQFRVTRTWMPRGFKGLQLAFVEVARESASQLYPILESLADEPGFGLFHRLLMAGAPRLAQALSQSTGPFTVFAPTDDALVAKFGTTSEGEILQMPGLEAVLACHVCPEKVTCEAFYGGRTLQGVDGTVLTVMFGKWPRGDPSVNSIPILNMDILCRNGLIHSVGGVLSPAPMPGKRAGRR